MSRWPFFYDNVFVLSISGTDLVVKLDFPSDFFLFGLVRPGFFLHQ